MISGIIRLFIGASNPVVAAIPHLELADAGSDRRVRPKPVIEHQIYKIQ
jgi:hypothetical protein